MRRSVGWGVLLVSLVVLGCKGGGSAEKADAAAGAGGTSSAGAGTSGTAGAGTSGTAGGGGGADGGTPDSARDTAQADAGGEVAGAAGISGACSASGWCWVNPLPQGNTLTALFAAAADDVWAGGQEGSLVHWDGVAPRNVPSGTTQVVTGLWGSSARDIWGVADGGAIIHYDGTRWAPVTRAATNVLRAIWGSAADDVWAAGKGPVQHYDGKTWQSVAGFSTSEARSIAGTARDNVWLADWYDGVFRHDGQSWRLLTAQKFMESIAPIDSTRAWACNIDKGGSVFSIDGATTTSETLFNVGNGGGCTSVRADGVGGFWFAGQDLLFRKIGTGPWTQQSTGLPVPIWSLSAAGGALFAGGEAGVLFRAAAPAAATPTIDRLFGGRPAVTHKRIWAGAPGVAWTASPTAKGLFRWDGRTWQPGWAAPGDPPINAVGGMGAGDLWAVGDGGLIAHFDGKAWSVQSSGTDMALLSVFAVAANDVWVGGRAGVILHFDGMTWKSIFNVNAGGDLTGLWADRDGVVATGDHGDGTGFIAQYQPALDAAFGVVPDPPLSVGYGSIYGAPNGELFVTTLTTPGNVLHYKGKGHHFTDLEAVPWEFLNPLTSPKPLPVGDLFDVWGTGPNDVWAVGNSLTFPIKAQILHWDGLTWTDVPSPGVFQTLRGVHGHAHEVWVVGDKDAILRLPR